MKKQIRFLGWIVVWLTSLFFIQNGIQKLIGVEQMVEMFRELGYPDWFRLVVGMLEVVVGTLLAIPKFTLFAAMGLGIIMTGAVISEVKAGHVFESFLPGQWLIVFVIVVYVRLRFRKIRKTNASNEMIERSNHEDNLSR